MMDTEFFIFLFIFIATVIINAIEIVILVKKRKNLSNYEWLLLSLSVTDLLVGLTKGAINLLLEIEIISFNNYEYISPLWFSIACSVSHTLCITLDRLSAVAFPIKHRTLWQGKTIYNVLIGAWSFGLTVFPVASTCSKKQTKFYLGILIIITSFVILISYSYIIYKAIIKRRRFFSKSSGFSLEQTASMSREFSLLCMCFVISLAFATMMLPFAISSVNHEDASPFAKYLLVSNSMTNPLLYFFWKYIDKKIKRRRINSSKEKNLSNRIGRDNGSTEANRIKLTEKLNKVKHIKKEINT